MSRVRNLVDFHSQTADLDGDGTRDLTINGTITATAVDSVNVPKVDLSIAPEVLTIDVAAPAAGQDTQWLWNWLTSSLPYARRAITNSNELNVPLYKQGTYTVNNFAKTQYGSMTQAHTMHFKWIDGAGTQNNISWVTDQGTFTDSHPDINGGNNTTVQRLSIAVPSTITPPTLTAPAVTYTVSFANAGAYTFSGPRDGDNPNIGPLRRGGTYTFNVNASGHPFYFTTDNGTNFSAGTYFGEYTSGVTGSRTDSGTVTFVVPANAPDTLYYQCGNHSSMRGAITIKDLAVETNNNGNYVVYAQHTQEGHKTPVELRPIPSLVNQMCIVYDASVNKFVPQDLATYVENTPSFENKIREVAGTAELVVEDGSAVVAKVNVYDDSTYLPLTGNNAGDQAFATDVNTLFIWDGTTWETTKQRTTSTLTEGSNLYYTDARVDARLAGGSIGNIVTTGYLAGPATFTIDPAAVGDNTGTVIIAGNLQVDGTTTTINSTTLTVDDLNITLASGAADANAANGAGITIDGANATFTYESAVDEFSFNKGIKAVDYSVSDGTKVIDSSKRGYFINIQNSNPVSFLNGSDGTSGTGAQGINVRHMYAGVTYANATAGAGDIEASANFKMAGNVVVDSSRNISGSTVSASTKFSTTGSNNEPILMATSGSFVRPKIRTASYSGTPETSLHFNQQSGASSSRNYYMGIYALNNANPYFYFDNRIDGPTHFQTNGSTRLSIASGGNVGLGTDNPLKTLDVRGSIGLRLDNGLMMFTDNNTDGSTNVNAGFIGMAHNAGYHVTGADGGFASNANSLVIGNYHSSGGDIILATTNSGPYTSGRVIIKENGNVGIGTNNPTEKFMIKGDGARMTISSNDHEVAMLGRRGSTAPNWDRGYLRLKYDSANTVVLDTGGVSYLNGGNVGIGTTSPVYKLHTSIGNTDGGIATWRNEEVGLNMHVDGASGSYTGSDRTVTLNATRIDAGTSPTLRLAGQGSVEFAVDANTVRSYLSTDSSAFMSGVKFNINNASLHRGAERVTEWWTNSSCTSPDSAGYMHVRMPVITDPAGYDNVWSPIIIQIKYFHNYTGGHNIVGHWKQNTNGSGSGGLYVAQIEGHQLGSAGVNFYRSSNTYNGKYRLCFSIPKDGCCCVGRVWVRWYWGGNNPTDGYGWGQTGTTSNSGAF